MIYSAEKNGFVISTDKSKLDIPAIHYYLSNDAYWSKNIPLDIVQKSIEGSVCFGIYFNEEQAGFARVITDGATFGYIADVFVIEKFRGMGLSKWMMQFILEHPGLQNFRRWMLATRDAHGLYKQFGFEALEKPERIMGLMLIAEYPAINKGYRINTFIAYLFDAHIIVSYTINKYHAKINDGFRKGGTDSKQQNFFGRNKITEWQTV